MKFTCPQCHRRYEVADEKVMGKTLQVQCRSCGCPIQVKGPTLNKPGDTLAGQRSSSAETRALPDWYAVIGGVQLGPISLSDLSARISKGHLRPNNFVWRIGMTEWKRARELAELAPYFSSQSSSPSRKAQVAAAPQHEQALLAEPTSAISPAAETGEATRFFIERAGVRKRNPAWKFALFGTTVVAIPVGLLFALSTFHVVPLEVTRVDDSGKEVKESVFSAKGVSGLKDLLLGRHQKNQEPHATASVRRASHSPITTGREETKRANAEPARNAELGSFYEADAKKDLGPRVRRDSEEPEKDAKAGLSSKDIHNVVDRTLPAFQNCIEVELRRNPGLKGGPLLIVATVATSGAVKEARIDRRDIAASNLGECLVRRARGMVFRASSEETDVEIPLKVIKSL